MAKTKKGKRKPAGPKIPLNETGELVVNPGWLAVRGDGRRPFGNACFEHSLFGAFFLPGGFSVCICAWYDDAEPCIHG